MVLYPIKNILNGINVENKITFLIIRAIELEYMLL